MDRFLDQCLAIGLGGLHAGASLMGIEIRCGSRPIWPDDPLDLYRLEQMYMLPVIVQRDDQIRITAICYRPELRGQGLFGRLIGKIERADLKPVVVQPVGPIMCDLLKRRGWAGREIRQPNGEMVAEWRPSGMRNLL